MTAKAEQIGGKWAEQVPDFARRIGEASGALRVLLFGSAARGDMREWSDLDFFLVIPDDMDRFKAQTRARRSLRGLKRPHTDIVAASESVIRRLRDSPYGVIKYAMDEGVEVWRAE